MYLLTERHHSAAYSLQTGKCHHGATAAGPRGTDRCQNQGAARYRIITAAWPENKLFDITVGV